MGYEVKMGGELRTRRAHSSWSSSCQGWAGMTFEGSGTGREGNWKSPFPKFGNGKGIKKSIPKFREWEGNEKIPFPKFGNGKGMKKIHSQNSGTGREWKNPFPKFGKGNQRPPFLGMTGNGNGNGNNILFIFWNFFFLGLPWKFFHWLCAPKSFPDSPTCIVTPKKIWDKNSM